MKAHALILASGKGKRYGSDTPKQFIKIMGKTILEHSIEAFEKNALVDEITVVITPEYKKEAENIIKKNHYTKVRNIINGGLERKNSSYLGVMSIAQNCKEEVNVLIHDCARPLVSEQVISSCIEALKIHEAVNVAIPATDTIFQVKDNNINKILNRSELMQSQTPQCFRLSLIKKAHELSKDDNEFTDDCALIVKHKLAKVFIVNGDIENIKITYPIDYYIADKLFHTRN